MKSRKKLRWALVVAFVLGTGIGLGIRPFQQAPSQVAASTELDVRCVYDSDSDPCVAWRIVLRPAIDLILQKETNQSSANNIWLPMIDK